MSVFVLYGQIARLTTSFFTSPIFSHRAEWLNGWHPCSLRKSPFARRRRLFALPEIEVKHD